MSRCRACPAIMTGSEIARKQPNGKPEELCTKCLQAAGVLGDMDAAAFDLMDVETKQYE